MFKTFIKAGNEICEIEKNVPAPYIRKSFEVDFCPEKAVLKICTPGFYEVYINGTNITKGFLAPYISNPSQVMLYDEYDIAKYLVKGKNAIGIILGNGFANQNVFIWDFYKAEFRAPLSVSAEIEAQGEGKKAIIETDETFKTHPSPILYDMYRYGTHYDARCEIDGWCSADFDDSEWENALIAEKQKGEILPFEAHPIKTQCELRPISIEKQENFCYLKTAYHGGEDIESTRIKEGYLYDFGQSRAGVCALKIKGEKGQKVTLRHCERLSPDGKFNINSIYSFKKENYYKFIHLFQTDVYTLKGGEEEIFIPPFTYHGFRYVFVEGITKEQATEDLLTFKVFNTDMKKRIEFDCSDETINKLFKMGIIADMSNFHYFPTDCPHREKNGWTGDASASAAQLLMAFDCGEDFRQWLKTISFAQLDSGVLPGIVPTSGWGYHWGNGPMWDSVIVTAPYNTYKHDGRIDIITENAPMIYKYLKCVNSRRDERGLVAFGLGDWCQPGSGNVNISSPLEVTDSATVYDMCIKSTIMFEAAGLEEEAEYARNFGEEMRASMRKNLIDFETMTAKGNCQTSQALFLSLGIFEEEEYDAAYKRLIEIIYEKDCHIDFGVVGAGHVFEVLMRGGDGELALKMICRDDEPSYGAMIKRGATALCEAFEENGVQESENHHFFGDILRIFVKYLAGLDIVDNMSFDFSPVFLDSLNYAKTSYQSHFGAVSAGWEREGDKIRAYINLPEGVVGTANIKEEIITLSAGYNEFLV